MATIVFRGEREPIQVTDMVAESVKEAKRSGKNSVIDTGIFQFETKDVKFIYAEDQSRSEVLPCENNCGAAEHKRGETCPMAYTAQCLTCRKGLRERDRSYSVEKFGSAVCREHSPVGEVELELGLTIGRGDMLESMMAGYIVAMKNKGKTTEEALNEFEAKLGKLRENLKANQE